MKNLLAIWLACCLCSGCSQLIDESALLPPATGEPGEIILVMDSTKWAGPLGEALRNTFRAPQPGLIQDEPKFNLIYVDPQKFNRVLKSTKNLIVVYTFEGSSRGDQVLQNYFTQESRQKMVDDPNLFMVNQNDLFAKGQSVLYLFQVSTDSLINHIDSNREKLQQYFIDVEKNRFSKALYKAPSEKGIENKLLNDHQCYLRVPYGYEIAVETDNTIWLRLMDRKIDKNIFITYDDYTSEEAFSVENIIKFRDQRWRRFILGDDSLSYMITEPLVPVDSSSVNIRNKFSVEVRGVWKLNNNSMGGPFLGYALVDQALGRLYYIEGFVYAPGEKKRNPLRELETILWTFHTQTERGS